MAYYETKALTKKSAMRCLMFDPDSQRWSSPFPRFKQTDRVEVEHVQLYTFCNAEKPPPDFRWPSSPASVKRLTITVGHDFREFINIIINLVPLRWTTIENKSAVRLGWLRSLRLPASIKEVCVEFEWIGSKNELVDTFASRAAACKLSLEDGSELSTEGCLPRVSRLPCALKKWELYSPLVRSTTDGPHLLTMIWRTAT